MPALIVARAACASSVGTLEISASNAHLGVMCLPKFCLNVQMSPSSEIFPTLIASTQRLGRGLGAAGTAGAGGATCLGGSGGRGSIGKFIVGFIVMTGAMLVFGACVVLIAASRFGQNLVTSHQSTARVVT